MEIYYGLLHLECLPFTENGKPYRITTAIAGSDTHIKGAIKEVIDWMVEKFAEDYYNIQDLYKTEPVKKSALPWEK